MPTRPRIRPPKNPAKGLSGTGALAHQPALYAAFQKLYGTLWQQGVVDHGSKELARLRNARVTDCGY